MICSECGNQEDFDRLTTCWVCNKCGNEIPDLVFNLRKVKEK